MPRTRSSSFSPTSQSGSQPARTPAKFSVGPVHVQRRGRKGVYEARWFDGKRRRRSLKTSDYSEALRLATQLADNHSSRPVQQPGEWNSPHPVGFALPGSSASSIVTEELPTLDVALDHFLAKKFSERRAAKTLSRYRHELTRLVQFLAGRAVTRIDRLRAEHYADYLDRSKRTRHISTLHDDVVIAKSFAKWLSDRYDLRNPLRTIAPPRIPDRSYYVLTIDEVHAILNAARREDPQLMAMLATVAFTGLRVGELVSLPVSSVDLGGGWVRVRNTQAFTTKTLGNRDIPIHPYLSAVLNQYVRHAGLPASSEAFFFPAPKHRGNPKGAKKFNYRTLNVRLGKLAAALGLPVGRRCHGVVVHSLRHFFRSIAMEGRVPDLIADKWMGHAHRHTRAVYAHPSQSEQKRLMNSLPFSPPGWNPRHSTSRPPSRSPNQTPDPTPDPTPGPAPSAA